MSNLIDGLNAETERQREVADLRKFEREFPAAAKAIRSNFALMFSQQASLLASVFERIASEEAEKFIKANYPKG